MKIVYYLSLYKFQLVSVGIGNVMWILRLLTNFENRFQIYSYRNPKISEYFKISYTIINFVYSWISDMS